MRCYYLIWACLLLAGRVLIAQEIQQYQVFAGPYDYTAIGNTLNTGENGGGAPCELLTESTATLSLETTQTIIAAYLYWAGSGTGDFEVKLNDSLITAERTFADEIDAARPFFAGFADVTEQLQAEGNVAYTFSELDLIDSIPPYCPTGTNFGGWAITVIYEDASLPLNQVNVFDGLDSVSQFNNTLTIQLENLNVLDNNNAKIGFVAWEGDAGLAVEETLSINGNLLSNPPLNPTNNQFNGTNSFTGADNLYNMDIDVYDIENNIDIGDTSAVIELTSGQDFVMINNIITVLNSQLPDAIIDIDVVDTSCDSRDIEITYTVSNLGTDPLPAGTLIAFYGDSLLTGTTTTAEIILPGDALEGTLMITVIDQIPDIFELIATVDDDEAVIESVESNNNSAPISVNLTSINLEEIEDVVICDDASNDGISIFDLTVFGNAALAGQTGVTVSYHTIETDALQGINSLLMPETFQNTTNPDVVFIRYELDIDPLCFRVEPLPIEIEPRPLVPILDVLEQCDDSTNDGISTFNLTLQEAAILDGQMDVNISYFLSLQDADMATNAIETPESYTNFQNPQPIYVRLENTAILDCYDIGFFDLVVTPIAPIIPLVDLLSCNEGFETGTFNLTEVEENITLTPSQNVTGYFLSPEDALQETSAISDPFVFTNTTNPQTIYVRIDSPDITECYVLAQFDIMVENCPPFVPEGFSPNSDGINDTFEISDLKDIFSYHLTIYSRLGNLVYKGDNEIPFWDGTPNQGIGGSEVPAGVYFWVLRLNDPNIDDMTGWVYLNR